MRSMTGGERRASEDFSITPVRPHPHRFRDATSPQAGRYARAFIPAPCGRVAEWSRAGTKVAGIFCLCVPAAFAPTRRFLRDAPLWVLAAVLGGLGPLIGRQPGLRS